MAKKKNKKAKKTGINRQFKDRLFRFIFGNPEHKDWTLNLYNAINGSSYENPDEIDLNTIEDILYMGMKNDVSFLITDTINFYEQQSSFNPNIPLRIFMYAGKAYAKFIEQRNLNLFSSTLHKIPTPKCICFYNGLDKKEDKVVLKLSDAFADSSDPQIEVTVTMLNVNYGHNKELMEACEPLKEYSWFVEEIRKNMDEEDEIGTAVDMALDSMPEEFVIRQFLLDNRAEVKDVLLTEYNEQKTMAAFMEEGEEKKAIKVAKRMLAKGILEVEDIAEYCELPIEKVKELAAQNPV